MLVKLFIIDIVHISGSSMEPTIQNGKAVVVNKLAYGLVKPFGSMTALQNVMVGEEPLDPEKTYSLASQNFLLLENGDGFTMFNDSPVLKEGIKLDNQVLIDYIVETLGGVIGEEYADLYGQGRITILE